MFQFYVSDKDCDGYHMLTNGNQHYQMLPKVHNC